MAAKPYHPYVSRPWYCEYRGRHFYCAFFSKYRLVPNGGNSVFRLCLSESLVKKLVD